MVGVNDFDDINYFYDSEQQLFINAFTISIHSLKTSFAKVNLDGSGFNSYCEIVSLMLESLDLPLTDDIATNLLAGIERATNSFKSMGVTAETFERVAQLMRLGARRIAAATSSNKNSSFSAALAQKSSAKVNHPQERGKLKVEEIKEEIPPHPVDQIQAKGGEVVEVPILDNSMDYSPAGR